VLTCPWWLSARQRAQNVVEYGLIVAVIAIASIAGFKALSTAEGGYFTGMAPAVAPTPPSFAPFVILRSTSTTISCLPASTVIYGLVNCNVTVTDTASGTKSAPHGSVTLSISGGTGTPTSPSCVLDVFASPSSSCSTAISYTPTSTGTQTITGFYTPGGGDTTHSSSASGPFSLNVTLRPTTTVVSCSPTPPATVPLNGWALCSVTVTDGSGGTQSVPGGTVTWNVSGGVGTFSPATCSFTWSAGPGNSSSCASVQYTPSAGTGTHTISATYAPGGGDSVHSGSPSNQVQTTVVARATRIAVGCIPASVPVNAATTCTATVTDNDNGTQTAPQGSITWSHTGSGTFTSTTCNLSPIVGPPPPAATCQPAPTPNYRPSAIAGSPQTISISYTPTDNHQGGTGSPPATFSLTVTTRSTSTAVVCNPTTVGTAATAATPANQGQATCTATVSDTVVQNPSTPQGTIAWTVSGTAGGSTAPAGCTLSAGVCPVTFGPPSAAGASTIAASYTPSAADIVHAASASSGAQNATETVPAPPSAPTGLTACVAKDAGCSATGNDVQLKWTAVSTATSYNVYRSLTSTNEGLAGTFVSNVAAGCTTGTCTYTDKSTSNNTQYYFEITAINPSESLLSTEAGAHT
jgi:Flp pilus assembly pilin Flp